MAGRPKKIQQTVETEVKPTSGVYLNEAISVAQDKSGQWGLVKIPFNVLTGEVGKLEFEPVGVNKSEASYRFKIYGYAGPEAGSKFGPILS